MTPKTFTQVFIKSEADLPKEEGDYFVHEKNTPDWDTDNYHFDKEIEDEYHSWLNNIDWYFQPLPDKSKTAEELDLIQYVTNLLYAAAHKDQSLDSKQFDKWVEEKTGELNEYFAQSQSQVMPSDEDIELSAETSAHIEQNKDKRRYISPAQISFKNGYIVGAKWMRDQLTNVKQ